MEVSVTLPNTFNGEALRKHFKQGFEQGNRGLVIILVVRQFGHFSMHCKSILLAIENKFKWVKLDTTTRKKND